MCQESNSASLQGILCWRQNEAEAHLDYAFEHCHARAANNKAAIARFLIPVRMLLGALPAMGLLEAFGLTVYAPFVEVPPCLSPCNLGGCIQRAGTVCWLW